MQNVQGFKKYQLKKKRKKNAHYSIISGENCKFARYLSNNVHMQKNPAFKNYQSSEKFILPELLVKNLELYRF